MTKAMGPTGVTFGRTDLGPQSLRSVSPVAIGGGRAVIAVPVMAKTLEESATQWREGALAGADIIEWRVDALEDVDLTDSSLSMSERSQHQEITSVGKSLRAAHKKPVLATVRTSFEGGGFPAEGTANSEAYLRLLQELSWWADAVDIEIEREGALETIRTLDVPVVASFHQFEGPIDGTALRSILKRMESSGAAVAKIACMVETPSDLEAVKRLGAWARENLSLPSVVIGMGEAGQETRLGEHAASAAFTFAVAGAVSAPGQLDVATVRASLPK